MNKEKELMDRIQAVRHYRILMNDALEGNDIVKIKDLLFKINSLSAQICDLAPEVIADIKRKQLHLVPRKNVVHQLFHKRSDRRRRTPAGELELHTSSDESGRN